jgi:site-specific recombinase XerD
MNSIHDKHLTEVTLKRLGRNHFAYLRSLAEGIPIFDSAQHYLDADTQAEAVEAHNQVVVRARAVARRLGQNRWRLVGLRIVARSLGDLPSIEDFQAKVGMEDWGMDEVLEQYQEHFGVQLALSKRKTEQGQRLRLQQLALYEKLEALDATPPSLDEPVTAWYSKRTSELLATGGIVYLEQLVQAIRASKVWYDKCKGVGKGKAQDIQRLLQALLPNIPLERENQWQVTPMPSAGPLPHLAHLPSSVQALPSLPALPSPAPGLPAMLASGTNLAVANPQHLGYPSDWEFLDAWVSSRASSPATQRAYLKEGRRLILWLERERGGLRLMQMVSSDCLAYMAFLQRIPPHWIGKSNSPAFKDRWMPFRGQLSHRSIQYALVVLPAFFKWLEKAKVVGGNPWELVNLNIGDERGVATPRSKALSEKTIASVLEFVEAQEDSPKKDRINFIIRFLETVGLRSAELLQADLQHFIHKEDGWFLEVLGKGGKARQVFIPSPALTALRRYLATRGELTIGSSAPLGVPLVSNVRVPNKRLSYRGLYKHVKEWLVLAIAQADLSLEERDRLEGVSTHWLRHTFGTRAVARNMPFDVIQKQLGHASVTTTINTYSRAPDERLANEMSRAFPAA